MSFREWKRIWSTLSTVCSCDCLSLGWFSNVASKDWTMTGGISYCSFTGIFIPTRTHIKRQQVSDSYSSLVSKLSYWRGDRQCSKTRISKRSSVGQVEEFWPWHVPNLQDLGLKEPKPKQLEGSKAESCKLTQSKKRQGKSKECTWTNGCRLFSTCWSHWSIFTCACCRTHSDWWHKYLRFALI